MSQNHSIPQAVQTANDVLQSLDSTQRDVLKKKLPSYALHLSKQGIDVTAELLQEHIQNGLPEGRKTIKSQKATYNSVAAPLRQDSNPNFQTGGIDFLSLSFKSPDDYTLDTLADIVRARGYKGYLQHFIEELDCDLSDNYNYIVPILIRKEEAEALTYLKQQGVDWTQMEQPISMKASPRFIDFLIHENYPLAAEELMETCIKNGQISSIKKLLTRFDDKLQNVDYSKAASVALGREHYDVIYLLTENNLVSLDDIPAQHQDKVDAYQAHLEQTTQWYKTHGHVPDGCLDLPPYLYKEQPWNMVNDALKSENVASLSSLNERDKIRGRYAYQASSLFRASETVLQYLEKWGKPGKMPLHDLVYMIELPKPTREEPYDLKAWGDAVLQCGPDMAKLVKFAGKLAQYREFTQEYVPGKPKRTSDGRRYSLRETQHAVAQVAYDRADENPRLATMCIHQWLSNDAFNTILDLVKEHENTQSNIPDLSITGDAFGLEGYTFRKLEDGDVRGLFLGNMTDCCQYVGSAGEDCAKHGFSSENGGFYVVEDKKGHIIGQSWAWRGTDGELVLDSLEHLGNRLDAQNWTDICNAMTKQLRDNASDITALHIGTGGKTPELPFPETKNSAEPVDYDAYRDSHKQYKVWRKNTP